MPLHVHDEPLVQNSRDMWGVKSQTDGKFQTNNPMLAPEDYKQNGDLLIQNLWYKGTDIIHNMHAMNTDASSYLYRSLEKCLQVEDK